MLDSAIGGIVGPVFEQVWKAGGYAVDVMKQEYNKAEAETMRLEQGVSDRLQDICREHNISREVLIEAMFEHCEAEPAVLKAVVAEANRKNEHRQQIANQRRAQSMMKRFGQSG